MYLRRALYLEPATFLAVDTMRYISSLLPLLQGGPGFFPSVMAARQRLDRLGRLPLETAREYVSSNSHDSLILSYFPAKTEGRAWLKFRLKYQKAAHVKMASDVAADSDYLSVVISSSLSSFGAQRRFPASITIGELKASCWSLIRAHLAVIRYAVCRASWSS